MKKTVVSMIGIAILAGAAFAASYCKIGQLGWNQWTSSDHAVLNVGIKGVVENQQGKTPVTVTVNFDVFRKSDSGCG